MNRPNNALEVLTWLLDPTEGYRGTGRTTTLISVYAALAITNPSVPITVRDHYVDAPTFHIRSMTDLVADTVRKSRPSGEVTRVSPDTLMFTEPDLNIHQEP